MTLLLALACVLLAWCVPSTALADSQSLSREPQNLFRYIPRPIATSVSTVPHPAVVRIIVEEKHAQAHGSGSYIAARERHGLVITNWHVVREAAGKIEAVFPDGFRSAATVIKTDRDWDLAALLIWRAQTEPLAISTIAPQPGDALTIAGYGPGDYRSALGKCTQYVAPSTKHPYEIVEVSAEARQGDSGGPILNDRGELAGVLFGASRGSTSGSYCGRVRQFLASIWPLLDAADPPADPQRAMLGTAPPTSPPMPADNSPPTALASASRPAALAPLTPGSLTTPVIAPETSSWPAASRGLSVDPSATAPEDDSSPPIVYTPLPPRDDSSSGWNWEKVAGPTPFDQGKTVLAIIGVLTVWGHVARWLAGGK
ncbi:MAG: trypsin-like peptidase domain-containing protein [Pirellulaceae bacterium]